MQSLHDTERLAKLSRALGVLSISIPLLSLLLPFFLQGIAINDPGPIATAFNLISTGGGLLGVPGLNSFWIPLAVGASIVSILLTVLFWHPWLPAGILLDVAILAAIYFHYPASLFNSN